jgi:ABC-type transporter Mla subunit MlaD
LTGNFSGVRVGTVSSIELPRKPGDNVIVVMSLDKATQGLIRRDSIASVQTECLIGF